MSNPGSPRSATRFRRSARRLALDVLYEAEIRDSLPIEAFDRRAEAGWIVSTPDDEGEVQGDSAAPDAVDYARTLVEGVQERQAALDEMIVRYADRWAIERMPIVDRNLLRIAIFELTGATDVPVAVAINEAVELAKSLSTEDSGRFINGLLGKIVEEGGLREP